MSFSKSKSKQTQTSSGTSTTSVDPWAKEQYNINTQGILDDVNNYTSQPFQPYTGQMVAGLSQNQQDARRLAGQNVGNWTGILGGAVDAAGRGLNSTWTPERVTSTNVDGPDKISATQVAGPREVTYREFDGNRIAGNMNPYKQNVVDAQAAYMDEQLARQLLNNQARATASGAYGGSRHGVADAELMRTSAMDKAQVLADLNYRGWNDAAARDERDAAGRYNADVYNSQGDYSSRLDNATRADAASQYNSQAGYAARLNNATRADDAARYNAGRADAAAQWAADNAYRGAGILGQLAGQKQQQSQADVGMLEQLGATDREIEQARLLASRAEFDRQAAEELRNLQLRIQARQGILGATPFGTTTTSSGTGTTIGKTSNFGLNFPQMFSGGLFGTSGAGSGGGVG